jgi:hypothetical protein
VSLILLAAVAAVAAAAAGVAVERRRASKKGAEEDAAAAAEAPLAPFANDGLPVGLGDVVSSDGQERWLAGALELRDGEHLVAVLFVAPEGSGTEAVCAFAPPRREILWLTPRTVDVAAEPPTAIELGGVVMQRRARVPARVKRHGQGTPDLGDLATFAEYHAGGREVGVVLRAPGIVLAWSGRRLDPDEYDRMGKGEL